MPGTVTNSSSSANVTGTSTTFLSTFQPGDTFTITSSGNTCIVKQITSNTALVCTANLAGSSSGSAYSFTQQTRLSVTDAGRTTAVGALYVSNPGASDQYSLRVDPADGMLKITANSVGNSSVGNASDSGNNNLISSSQFNSGSGGTINALRVYFPFVDTSPNNHVKVAVYSDSSGLPGTLLSSNTAPSTVATAAAWTTVSLGTSITLTPNTNYWFAFNVDGAATNYRYSNGASNTAKYVAMTYSGNFPASFGTPSSSGSNLYSVYGVYTSVTDQSLTKNAIKINGNNDVSVNPLWDSQTAFNVYRTGGSSSFSVDTINDYAGMNNLAVGDAFDSNYKAVIGGTTKIYRHTATTTNNLLELYSDVGGTSTQQLKVQANGDLTTIGKVTAASFSGAGLTDCDATNSKLLWDTTTSQFSCGTDRASVTIRKTADESVTSSTTLQNDDQLTFSIGANETYIYHIIMNATMASAGSIKYTVTAPSGATCSTSSFGIDSTGSGGELLNAGCGTSGFYGGTGTTSYETIDGTVTTGATPGTVTLQWAQNSSNGTATVVKAGSQLVAYKVSGADLAEAYYTKDTSITSGDIVSLDPSASAGVTKSTKAYDTKALGVVSTQPGQVLSNPDAGKATGRPVLVALSGRIPVKVTAGNGAIHAGDFLTASPTPGVAMKATKPGQVIGRALEDYDNAYGNQGLILMFASQQWADPRDPDGQQLQSDLLQSANVTNLTAENATITNLTVTKNAEFKGDVAVHGNTSVVNILVNGHIVTGGDVPTIAAGNACSAADVNVSGTDTAGLVTVTTTPGCAAQGDLAKIAFAKAFGSAPRVTLTSANANAAALKTYIDSSAITTTSFTIATPTAVDGSLTYRWYYQVLQ